MKEFEKQFPKPRSVAGMVNDDPLSWWEEKQEGWKAALEWVEILLGEHSNSGGGIIDYIEQELRE